MITPDNPYFRQVQLLVRVLPVVARKECFALKGGTAINLFLRDMPRLSVDIDLAYLPINDRETALHDIDAAMRHIGNGLQSAPLRYRVQFGAVEEGRIVRLHVSDRDAQIKIEVTPVSRGTVYPESMLRIVPNAEAQFGFAEVRSLSFEDLYAGKIVAALDRQHPRDLFDVKLLLENEGISAKLFQAFLVYVISHDRSMAQIIQPPRKPLAELYETQFRNMSAEPVTLEELSVAREELIGALRAHFSPDVKDFLLSFKRNEPRWDLMPIKHARELPAVQWKMLNLAKMTPGRSAERLTELERVLNQLG